MIDSRVMNARMHAHPDRDDDFTRSWPPWCPPQGPSRYVFSREGIRAVDQAAVERYGIPGLVLMENAARGLLAVAIDMLPEPSSSPPIFVFCGSGNNGGDGYALARHLSIEGYQPIIVPINHPAPESDAGINAAICARMNPPTATLEELSQSPRPALIVDAIFGTGLDRSVDGEPGRHIKWINESGAPVLAVDVPSGMNAETGEAMGIAVIATRTVTFAGLKRGFLQDAAAPLVGRITIASIGAPRELLEEFSEHVA